MPLNIRRPSLGGDKHKAGPVAPVGAGIAPVPRSAAEATVAARPAPPSAPPLPAAPAEASPVPRPPIGGPPLPRPPLGPAPVAGPPGPATTVAPTIAGMPLAGLRNALTPTAAPAAAAAPVAPPAPPAPLPKRFRYDWRLLWPVRIVGYGLLVLAGIFLASTLAWALPYFMHLWGVDWHPFLAAAASTVLAFALAQLLINALPTFEPGGRGLLLRGFLRPILLPWNRITQLRSLELPGDRYLVFLEYSGRPLTWTHQVYTLLAGQGRQPGVFIVGNVDRFDDLLRLILRQRMVYAPPGVPGSNVESLLDEQAQMPLFQMLLDPQVTAVRLGDLPAVDPDAPADDWQRALAELAQRPKPKRAPLLRLQAGLALVPPVIYLIDLLTRGYLPSPPGILAALGLFGLGLLELPLVALTAQALGEQLFGQGLFNLAFGVYPYLELPRVLAFLPIVALLAIQGVLPGLALLLALLIWLAAAAWTGYLTALFTMRLYQLADIRKAALPGAASFAVQFVLVLLYLVLGG